MQIVNFYILPVHSYSELSVKDISEVIEQLEENGDRFFVPDEFYTTKDCNGQDFWGLYSSINSEIKLFINKITKKRVANYSYADLISMASADYHTRFVCDFNFQESVYTPEHLAKNDKTLIQAYRNCAKFLEDYAELFDWKYRCYPKLLFTEDSFGTNKQAVGDYGLFEELNCCLSALNDMFEELKLYPNEERLRRLQTETGIRCSGKGGKETQSFDKTVCIKLKENNQVVEKKFTISCIPHFKLLRADSDYRLYFSWGRSEIQDFAVIIAHVGEHWQDKKHSVESKIKRL